MGLVLIASSGFTVLWILIVLFYILLYLVLVCSLGAGLVAVWLWRIGSLCVLEVSVVIDCT